MSSRNWRWILYLLTFIVVCVLELKMVNSSTSIRRGTLQYSGLICLYFLGVGIPILFQKY